MKKRILYIIYITLITSLGNMSMYSQGITIDNTGGKLNNNGTIRVRAGQVKNLPDSLGGRIEFSAECQAYTQEIPNIKYWQLIIKGKGFRPIREDVPGKPLVAYDSLVMIGETEVVIKADDIHAKNAVENTINVYGNKEIRLNGSDKEQDIIGNGKGKFPNLNIDNPHGVNIINGGFTVDSSLTLTQGKLNNSSQNFKMRDSTLITRYAGGSVAEKPTFEGKVDVTYKGAGSAITTGGEIPNENEKLQNLRVENEGGIVMSQHIQVNRSLYVGAKIATEFDDARRYVLTYTPAINPDFSMSPQAEIDGTMRRTTITYNDNMLFNNRFTWALFKTEANAGGIKALNFRIKPKSYFALPDAAINKVQRTIEIWAENPGQNDTVSFVPSMDVGYAWRTDDGSTASQDETNGLPADILKLKRWNGTDAWIDIPTSSTPQKSDDGKWYTANATNIDLLGKFVIGMDGGGNINLIAKVYLEGPYFDSVMSTDLAKYDLLPRTPHDEYPYNLDKKRANVKATVISMKDIVDWIVMEFKTENRPSQYVCLMLNKDGKILSPNGDTVINLTAMGVDTGNYYIGILHRNHLPVYSMNKFRLKSEFNGQVADFTKTTDVYGKEGSLRALDIKGGFILYGMVAGDVNGDNVIDEKDYKLTWENRDVQFMWSRYDINMTGYVNTKDLNFPWNNRNRSANVP